ncbi:hypothetical protein AAF712_011388 [Marasmius tenuissimus]|uniref:Mob1/phocein n=1 Tax=Marasmius tenuissimus TaxID=585030 RepID=A0ABR2ZKC8_9AGAR
MQRPLRGSRISSFYPVKSLPQLSSLDSAFQLQEYISLLIRSDVHDVERIIEIPGKAAKDDKPSTEPKENDTKPAEEKTDDASSPAEGKEVKDATVDEYCWIYEHLRRLAQDLSHPLITMLQQECNRASCPEMKAGEWLYLCVAHGNDGAMEQCCAIDYILHTIDSATALLNSPRAFPSRLAIPQTSHRHFSSLARRLGRVFAHAYYHHREVFEQAEAESSLYKRFLRLTERFGLVPREFLVIPGSGEPSAYETRGGPLEDTEGDRSGGKVILGKEIPYEQAYPTWSRAPPPEREEPAQTESQETHSSDSPLDPELSLASGGGPPGLSTSTSPSPPGSGFARTGRSRTDTMVLHPPKEDKEPSSPPVNPSIPDTESPDTSSSSQPETSSSSASLSEPESPATTAAPDSVEPTESTEQVVEEEVKEDAEVTKQDDAPTTTPSDAESPEADRVEEPEVTPSSSITVAPSSEEETVEAEIASSEVPVEAKSASGDAPVEEAQSESAEETQEQAAGEEAQEQKVGKTEAVEPSSSSAETKAPEEEEETKAEGGNDVVEDAPTEEAEEAEEDAKVADTDAETSKVSEDKKEDSKEEEVKVVDFGAATDAAAASDPAKEEEKESKAETKEEEKEKDKESS